MKWIDCILTSSYSFQLKICYVMLYNRGLAPCCFVAQQTANNDKHYYTATYRLYHSSDRCMILTRAVLTQGWPRDAAVNFGTYRRSLQQRRAVFTAIATLSN